jgi:hypothetical protein
MSFHRKILVLSRHRARQILREYSAAGIYSEKLEHKNRSRNV